MTFLPQTTQAPVAGTMRSLSIVCVVLGLLTVIATLALDVRDRLRDLDPTESTRGQWVITQTEVEVLRLQNALTLVQARAADTAEVRRWFNVFYSRLQVLDQSPLYARFIQQRENRDRLTAMQAYVDRWTTTIDAADPDLLAALPAMIAETAIVQRHARDLSLASLRLISTNTDKSRTSMAQALMLLAIAVAATMMVLALLAITATRLFRITQTQARENRLAGDRLQLIIATSPDAILVTNRGGWVVEFNPMAEAMFGMTRAQVLERHSVELLAAPEHHETYRARLGDLVSAAAQSGPQRFEITARRADGSALPLEVSLAVRDLDNGALIVSFLRDISGRLADQEALETALTRAQAGEKAKADFLAVMSHEMRTPLNGLIGSMALLRDTPLDENQREVLRIMDISGSILLGHISSVLDPSRTAAGQIQPSPAAFALDRLIEDCLANQAALARNRGNSLQYTPLCAPFGRVWGDPDLLRQILLNLIGNAVKFTRDGTITVESERVPAPPHSVEPQWIEVRVLDTGIGISPEDLERVFDDFATVDSPFARETGGTGLGLGIARRLAQSLGGSIGAESEPGEGSLFWVRLPLPDAGPNAGEQPVPHKPAVGAGPAEKPLDILLIDDNDINRFVLHRMLSNLGHRVTEASDGATGVAVARDTRFDLIITDIAMPGLNGIEATRRIRAAGASRQARIIALTAHALPEDLESFQNAGLDACLTKPVSRDALLAQVFAGEGSGPAPSPPALVEDSALEALTAHLGASVAASLVDRMLAEGDRVIAGISAGTPPDATTARSAHLLAGSCTTFGALALREALSGLERAIETGDTARANHLVASLPDLWARTRALLAPHGGSDPG